MSSAPNTTGKKGGRRSVVPAAPELEDVRVDLEDFGEVIEYGQLVAKPYHCFLAPRGAEPEIAKQRLLLFA